MPRSSNNVLMDLQKYWRTNLKYLGVLLSVWFLLSFGFGILMRDSLDSVQLGGFPLGFWFAQQGSIFGFVIIIAVYVILMNRLDDKYDLKD